MWPCADGSADLGWHTHLLFPPLYRAYTTMALGRICNHDDTLDRESVNDGLGKTAQHWFNVYKEPYTSKRLHSKYLSARRVFFSIICPPYAAIVTKKAIKLRNAAQRQRSYERRMVTDPRGDRTSIFPVYRTDAESWTTWESACVSDSCGTDSPGGRNR
ncbi:hypothetical protein BC938DRAFT_482004 [Jimgerdemannia flammicorona]|uniref:Uncharacterized protein n=1 Tax=Jimgerdemannia flammicorona TaxID=994334 RepID=A0A433QEU4_9FUNG|nr:hypothetical protein BC938DRAFT_482004 [Jimgerdemannia flammicorona]